METKKFPRKVRYPLYLLLIIVVVICLSIFINWWAGPIGHPDQGFIFQQFAWIITIRNWVHDNPWIWIPIIISVLGFLFGGKASSYR